MFPLLLEPLAPARPEIADAAPYNACGCVHHRHVQSAPTSPLPSLRSPTQRSRLFAEASEARRRLNQCRDWASVVAGAARDAVHFNVVDYGSPYASGQRTLPAFYYDPEGHEPGSTHVANHSHGHGPCDSNCTSSPRGDKIADVKPRAKRSDVKLEVYEHEDEDEHEHEPVTGLALGLRLGLGTGIGGGESFRHYRPRNDDTILEYQYARIEVLDDKPRHLHVEPHLEGSALRKRRRSPNASNTEPPTQRIKAEPMSPCRPSSVPAPTRSSTDNNSNSSHDRRTGRHPQSRGDRGGEPPRAPHAHGLSQERQARQERPVRHMPSPPRPHAQAMLVVLSTQSAPDMTASADTEQGRAPDQDSPKRIIDPLPSIGGLWCARDPRSHHHHSSHSSSSAKGKP